MSRFNRVVLLPGWEFDSYVRALVQRAIDDEVPLWEYAYHLGIYHLDGREATARMDKVTGGMQEPEERDDEAALFDRVFGTYLMTVKPARV